MPREDPREKAKKLLELAFKEGTPKKEKATAIRVAARIIYEHGLLEVSSIDAVLDGAPNETVRALGRLAKNKDVVDTIKTIFGGRRK